GEYARFDRRESDRTSLENGAPRTGIILVSNIIAAMNFRRPVAIAATLALHGFVLAGIVAWTDKTIQPPPPQPMRVALVADVATSPAAVHEGTGPAVPEQDTPVPEIAAAPATAAAEPP